MEQSTVQSRVLNAVSAHVPAIMSAMSALEKAVATARAQQAAATNIKFCALDDLGCEACQ